MIANKFQLASGGALNGYSMVPVDLPYMKQLHMDCQAIPVRYKMGAKPPHIEAVPIGTDKSDCSGYMRWLLYHATHGALLLPDGSWNEYAALLKDGFKPSLAANAAAHDGHVRVCIHVADNRDETGHIWTVVNGVTYECYGGHGVGSRAWNATLSSGYRLDELATHVYVLC